MALELYKIDLARKFMQNAVGLIADAPLGVKIAVAVPAVMVAVVAAPIEIAAAVGVFITAVVIGGEAFGGGDQKPSGGLVTVIDQRSDLDKFRHYHGERLDDGYYFAHPQKPKILLPAKQFHSNIQREQIEDICAFLRSRLRVKRLRILRVDLQEGKVKLNIPAGEGGMRLAKGTTILSEHEYNNPKIVKPSRELYWMSRYRIIEDAVKGAGSGKSHFHEKYDLSFGLTAEVAKLVGVDADWLSTKTLTVDVEYG